MEARLLASATPHGAMCWHTVLKYGSVLGSVSSEVSVSWALPLDWVCDGYRPSASLAPVKRRPASRSLRVRPWRDGLPVPRLPEKLIGKQTRAYVSQGGDTGAIISGFGAKVYSTVISNHSIESRPIFSDKKQILINF